MSVGQGFKVLVVGVRSTERRSGPSSPPTTKLVPPTTLRLSPDGIHHLLHKTSDSWRHCRWGAASLSVWLLLLLIELHRGCRGSLQIQVLKLPLPPFPLILPQPLLLLLLPLPVTIHLQHP